MNYFKRKMNGGFTLIETLVAISLLMLALIAPMSLTAQSLTAAYYARDQITAFYLAQEGIEVVRSVRDANIMAIAEGNSSVNIFDNIPTGYFTVDSSQPTSNALHQCANNGADDCPPLQTDPQASNPVYAYPTSCEPSTPGAAWTTIDCAGTDPGWTDTTFTRTVKAYLLNADDPDEMRVTVTVTWQEGSFQTQSFTINEDLYRWVNG